MNSRVTLIFAALVVLLGAMIWVVQDRRTGAAGSAMALQPSITIPVAPTADPALASAETPVPQRKSWPAVQVDASGTVTYVARDGDTVSQLAMALLGSDSKEHREAVVAENPSLQSNPDRVLEGQTYSMPSPLAQAANNAATERQPKAVPSAKLTSDEKSAPATGGPELKYTAQAGDTVSGLASNLLGGDTKANRQGIIAENASLQRDADHLVAGRSYTIVARNGLAADPAAPQAKAPSTQPEADEAALMSVGRTLRYAAKPGDTVSKLAVALLGSDTRANRHLIIKSNPSLKQDPDHLVAGRTYWIAAPTVDSAQ